MTNAFGVVLDSASLRWAAAEGVPSRINRKTGNRLKQQNVDSETAELVPRCATLHYL